MKKIVIIGGGPIGLNLAKRLEEKNVDYLLIEASDKLGGQLTELYPHKEIVDIPEIMSITAENYIKSLLPSINMNNVHLEERVLDIHDHKVYTNKASYDVEKVVICTGLGFYSPRKMGLENEDHATNVLYSLKDFSFLANKRVAIFGGGDSALDWAKETSRISDNVSLIHRRTEFRGNADTIKDCTNLTLYLPYVPNKLNLVNTKATSIEIKKVDSEDTITLDVDYILVNYGNIPSPMSFSVPREGAFAKVDESFKCADYIYAIGDAASYPGKVKRIAPGLKEINAILNDLI